MLCVGIKKIKFNMAALYAIASIFIACKQRTNTTQSAAAKVQSVASEKQATYHHSWMKAINNADGAAIEKLYDPNAIKLISEDSIVHGALQISRHYQSQKSKIASIESVFKVEANADLGITYELIKYKTENRKEHVQLVIWKQEDAKAMRVFEFTEIMSLKAAKVDTSAIGHSRKLWIKLCNENNAKNLIEQLYSPNTMYFNHKPLIQGREALIKEYGYMNNPNYTLSLRPLKLVAVNSNFAYEIGQCQGSYSGKYILVWKKGIDGDWKIYIDSNI